MVARIYSIYDSKLKEFAGLYVGTNDGAIVRDLGDWLRSPGNVMAKHPDDYELFFIGQMVTETGIIDGVDIVKVVTLSALLPREE